MPTSYTVKNLSEVPDSAPQFGLELLAFGLRHEDDGEVVLDRWTERSPRSIPLQAARSELSAGGPELDT